MAAQVRPFDFSRLPKLSSRQVMINERLLALFPQFSDGSAIGSEFLEPLSKDLNLPLSLRFSGITENRLGDFISTMANPCVTVVLRLMPTEQRMILEVDDMLARMLVERLLGGETEFPKERAAFSAVEEGVFEFLMLKVLSRLRETPGMEGPASLRIARIVYEGKLLADAGSGDEAGCVLKFHLALPDGRGGYLRLFFPHPLVEGLLLQDAGMPEDPEVLARGLERVGHIKTAVWAEVGRVNLMASELAQLEKEDVIVFDESYANMGPHGVSGKAVLRVGETPEEGFLAELIDSEGKVVVKLLDFYGG